MLKDTKGPGSYVNERTYVYEKLASAVAMLDSYGVESRGIERIKPYERTTNHRKAVFQVVGLWMAAAGGLSSLSLFILGPLIFELGFKDSLIYGFFGQFVGCFVAAYCSLMGPRSGCRQMVSARFLFGWWFVKIVALFAILGVMGYSVTNSVLGGEILMAVSDNKVPLDAGIIIVAVISVIVSIFGIKQLLRVEIALSVPILFSFFLMYIAMKDDYQYLHLAQSIGDPATIKGHQLSFFALSYSVTSTWGSIASDYYLVFPETSSDLEVFTITFFGILVPTTFTSTLGVLLSSIALAHKPWNAVYQANGLGGLLTVAYDDHWGKGSRIFPVLLYLSLITNNILNCYSAAFGIQLNSIHLAKVPRCVWVVFVTAVYLIAALVGKDHFSEILGNFLPMIGYWISVYFILLVEENVFFRNKWLYHKLYTVENEVENDNVQALTRLWYRKNLYYNFTIWDDYDRLTHGYAAIFASLCGAAGAVVGMDQTYYVGPIGRLIGRDGGDLGMWLSMGFAGAVFVPLRYWELKVYGK